jgi:hypothetical protein
MAKHTMSDDEKQTRAERYREAQAQKILDVFERAHGRPASTVEELAQWVASPEGQAALAYYRDKDGKIIP